MKILWKIVTFPFLLLWKLIKGIGYLFWFVGPAQNKRRISAPPEKDEWGKRYDEWDTLKRIREKDGSQQ